MTEYICVFCEQPMTAEQFICCDTYKGKISIHDYYRMDGDTESLLFGIDLD